MEWLKSWREQIEKERQQLILLAEKEKRGKNITVVESKSSFFIESPFKLSA